MTSTDTEPGSGAPWSFFRDALEHSSFVNSVRELRGASSQSNWKRGSTAVELLGRSGRVITAVVSSSTAARSGRRLGEWTSTSAIYRWLTKEPEPEIIVIDLRKTATVGPLIAGLDRLIDLLRPAVRRSRLVRAASAARVDLRRQPVRTTSWAVLAGAVVALGLSLAGRRPAQPELVLLAILMAVAALGTRVTTPWEELRDARTIRLLAAVLEPPAPVDQTARTAHDEERLATETDRE